MSEELMPDKNGRFGIYGGRYVAETLVPALEELSDQYELIKKDNKFIEEFRSDLAHYVGRPSPLYFAKRWTELLGGAKIYLKREDLNHTGAHKINNTVGQILLAKHMGKKRIIAETGAGQHGVATASVAARHGLECIVYMGEEDIKRQSLNVFRIKLLGAKVVGVSSGTSTLKDAMNEAMRDWVTNVDDTYYIIGSVAGPHPYPQIVRDFNAVVGEEVLEQSLIEIGKDPDVLVACVGGGSNAIGIFSGFMDDTSVELIGVEASGEGVETKKHAATMTKGSPGILHGSLSYVLQDEYGQIQEAHSISAGLDYPGVGPEHSYLKDIERAKYFSATDEMALEGFKLLSVEEGIIPALEPAHALGFLLDWSKEIQPNQNILFLLSGRGDKDMETVSKKIDSK